MSFQLGARALPDYAYAGGVAADVLMYTFELDCELGIKLNGCEDFDKILKRMLFLQKKKKQLA